MNFEEEMVGAIVIVGDEIVRGEIQDTNYKIAAKELDHRGIDVKCGLIIPDKKNEIIEAIERSVDLGANLIVVSGGLGSTHDDVTKEAVSKWSDQPLTLDEDAFKQVQGIKGAISRESEDEQKKVRRMLKEMSKIPKGSKTVENPSGINPGFILDQKASIVVLPGVPTEFKSSLKVALGKLGLSQIEIRRESIKLDKPENFYADSLMKTARKFTDVGIGSYPKINEPNQATFRSLNEKSLKEAVAFFLNLIKVD